MAQSSNSSSLISNHKHLNQADMERLLNTARPFLRCELQNVDENLPRLMSVLQAAGAGECWHKHGSFLDHLLGVYRILKMWGAPDAVCLCGLFHSAYSNSYVNLAIFPPNSVGRDTVRGHVGSDAEELIHLFCVIPRQALIHDLLLFKYRDEELIDHLRSSAVGGDGNQAWRTKLRSVCPPEGIKVKHIKTDEEVVVPRKLVAVFLVLTMADFSDQLFSFQDELFENSNGWLEFSGSNVLASVWPGDGKPGLWMNSISRMGAIYTLIVREEKLTLGGEVDLVIPPVLDGCTKVVDAWDQITARDLYWEAVCNAARIGAEDMLVRSAEKNPFVGEVHIVLAQIRLGKGEFEAAEMDAARGLKLLLEWGSPWDKRMTWQGWIAWTRVLLSKARDRSWPDHGWGILNLGLVR